MLTQIATPDSLEQVVNRILSSRKITRKDQISLLSLYSLTAQQKMLTNRVFDLLRAGLIRVVD